MRLRISSAIDWTNNVNDVLVQRKRKRCYYFDYNLFQRTGEATKEDTLIERARLAFERRAAQDR